jgi:hypothetical protein
VQVGLDVGETSTIDVNRIEVELQKQYWHDKGARNCSF